MKTLYVIIAATMISASAIAGGGSNEHPAKYCTRLKNGKLILVHEGKTVTSDVKLTNGVIIKIDGTIVRKDGSTTMMKQDQCADKDGIVMDETKTK